MPPYRCLDRPWQILGSRIVAVDRNSLPNQRRALQHTRPKKVSYHVQMEASDLRAHVLELDLAIEVDERGFEQIGRPSDETVILGYERLDGQPARLSSRLGDLWELVLGGQEFFPSVRRELARSSEFELFVFVRVSRSVLLHSGVPLLFRLGALVLATRKVVVHLVWDAELLTGIEPELGFHVGDLVVAKSLTVSGAGVGFTG